MELRMTRQNLSSETRVALARAIDLVIAQAGSVAALAEALGISYQAVSCWRRHIPVAHVIRLEELTGISREVLRPDLYGPKSPAAKKLVHRPRQELYKSREAQARRAVL